MKNIRRTKTRVIESLSCDRVLTTEEVRTSVLALEWFVENHAVLAEGEEQEDDECSLMDAS